MKNINNYELGKLGEKIAEKYLIKNNYEIIEKNFYCKNGEIDIIAKYKDYIIFVEVKTRRSLKYGNPSEAVNSIKRTHMYKTAKYYLFKNKKLNNLIRFDVIEILVLKEKVYVNHIKQIL